MTDPIGDLECTVVEARLREPGFYQTDTRVFYVSRDRLVYLLQAPGAGLILQREDDLPEDASSTATVDAPRRELAELIERHDTRSAALRGQRHAKN